MLENLYNYFNLLHSTLGFYLPIGLIGIWRWVVWLIMELVAVFYRPKTEDFAASVSIITPVYNEDPVLFKQALKSWQENNPLEIIAVIDQTDQVCIQIFQDFSQEFVNAKLIVTSKPGKRPALVDGIEAARGEIVALVDSDTLWAPQVLPMALSPFADPQVGGVTVRQNIVNPKTLAQKIFDIQLDLRYSHEMPFLTVAGNTLICLSGRTAFYRRTVVLPMLGDLLNETFLGKPVISGDDKRLTHLVQAAGWKTSYQGNVQVFTPGMAKMKDYMKQRLRWTRNALRADMKAMWQGWVWKHPALAFFMVDKVLQSLTALISPVYFVAALIFHDWFAAGVLMGWWMVSRTIKIYAHLRRRPQDISIMPFFILFAFISAVSKVYAFFTLNTQGWITRWDKVRLPRFKFLSNAPAYLGSALTLMTIGSFVVWSKNKDLGSVKPEAPSSGVVLSVHQVKGSESIPNQVGAQTEFKDGNTVFARYVVQAEDYLEKIAQDFNVLAADIVSMNTYFLPDPGNIEPGLVLTIPLRSTPLNGETNLPKTSSQLKITYNDVDHFIEVSGYGSQVALATIAQAVGPNYLVESNPHEWLLKASLKINRGVVLHLSAQEVGWLKLESDSRTYTSLETDGGAIEIDHVKITSWDSEKNEYDYEVGDGRSFILAKNRSRLDILGSELAYLGFVSSTNGNSEYGVSWRSKGDSLQKPVITGVVVESKFHDNYYGAYVYQAAGMVWRGNEFFNNIKHGLRLQAYSNSSLIESNRFYQNGGDGLVLSEGCFNDSIQNNESFSNQLRGIVMSERSNFNTIEKNSIYNNKNGFVILNNSNSNLIQDNELKYNFQGIKIGNASQSNLIQRNSISNHAKEGIYVYQFADNNQFKANVLTENNIAISVKSSENRFIENIFQSNQTGVQITDEYASRNSFENNQD